MFHFIAAYLGSICYYLNFIARWNQWETVLRHVFEIISYFRRSYFHISCNFTLHFVNNHHSFQLFHGLLANLCHGLAHIFLKLFFGTSHLNHIVQTIFQFVEHIAVLYLYTIYQRLMKKEFLYSHLLGNNTTRISFHLFSVYFGCKTLFFNFGFQYRVIANNPNNLVDYIIVLGKSC